MGHGQSRNQLDPQQDVIYQAMNHRVLISSSNQKPLPTATIPTTPQLSTDVYVHRNSVVLEGSAEQPNVLWLGFVFDAKCECAVTVHFYTAEVVDEAYVTLSYISDSPHTQPKRSFPFPAGLAQSFPAQTLSLNIANIPEAVLLCKDRKTYPLIIDIVRETQHPATDSLSQISQSTLIALQKEGEGYKARVVYQKYNTGKDSFYVEEVFGLTGEENECVVCMSDRKDTAVLPCRHICLCTKCAHTMRSQKQPKCPICRTSKG